MLRQTTIDDILSWKPKLVSIKIKKNDKPFNRKWHLEKYDLFKKNKETRLYLFILDLLIIYEVYPKNLQYNQEDVLNTTHGLLVMRVWYNPFDTFISRNQQIWLWIVHKIFVLHFHLWLLISTSPNSTFFQNNNVEDTLLYIHCYGYLGLHSD